MAGGRWTSQNKVRPGAYINFRSVPKPLSSVGTRGIVTFPIALTWGPSDRLIELFSTDLIDGRSVDKIGISMFDDGALPFKAALSNAYKAWVFRMDTGGTKASGILTNLSATAKYPGITGNDLTVMIVSNPPPAVTFDVITIFKGREVDRQTVVEGADIISNDYIDFIGDGDLSANAGVPLEGGTNGTVSAENFTNYVRLLQSVQWNTLGVPYADPTIIQSAVTYIKHLREDLGIARQAVINNSNTPDYEGIISTKGQGFEDEYDSYDPEMFVLYYAGLTAGANITTSRTYFEIPGALRIINPLLEEEIEQALNDGYVILTNRQDGATVVEQDINTLHTFTPDKNYVFSKNRVIRVLDEINNSIALLFERSYIGKVNNDENGRTAFKADCIAYINTLQDMGAIQNFDPTTDITVSAGISIDSVVVDLAIQPVDSMEKLYMTVMVE